MDRSQDLSRRAADLERRVADHAPGALIFDCDGTLTDSMPVHYEAWRDVLDPLGLPFPEERFYGWAGIPTDKIIERLASEHGIAVDARELAHRKEAQFLVHLDHLRPVEAVVALARGWAGRMPLAVASGGLRDVIDQQLRRLDLRHLFMTVVTAEDTERHKPEPDVFLEAARRMAVPPEVCCVLEDSDLGIQAARSAGMTWVDVRPFYG